METIPSADQNTPAAPEWSSLVSTLPADLQNEGAIKNLKDFGGAMKAYVDAQKYVGGSVRIPKADAPAEEWAAFHSKVGVPGDPNGYTVPQNLPNGIEFPEAERDWLFGLGHKAGISQRSMETLLSGLAERRLADVNQGQTLAGERLQATEAALKQQYGAAYDRNMTLALRAIERHADADTFGPLKEGGFPALLQQFGHTPWLLDAMVQLGHGYAEDKLISGEVEGAMNPDQAQSEWNAITADSKHPYWDEQNAGHGAAVKHVEKLFQSMFAKG